MSVGSEIREKDIKVGLVRTCLCIVAIEIEASVKSEVRRLSGEGGEMRNERKQNQRKG